VVKSSSNGVVAGVRGLEKPNYLGQEVEHTGNKGEILEGGMRKGKPAEDPSKGGAAPVV